MSPPSWKSLTSLNEFDELLEQSREKPALILIYRRTSPDCVETLRRLDREWTISKDQLDTFLVDEGNDPGLCAKIGESAGVPLEIPQVLLFADGVTMYDESHEMINVKKIKIALKIINRTFKWMESRA
jgi:bacillithiol system protein YtxJ